LAVLVTGGAGYIGSHTARVLRRHGYEVVLYDNLSTGHEFLARGFEFIPGDIGDSATMAKALARVDAVLHFAAHAYVGESVENPRKYFRNNVESALTLLNACQERGLRHFVFSSTCAVYGTPQRIPIPEDAPRAPVNPYGVSKMFFEQALEAYDRAYGLRSVCLRYFNAAGADESGEIGEVHDPETHLIPAAFEALQGQRPALEIFGHDYPTPDGTCIRDYIHVNDLAEAHLLALQHLESGGASLALNLGTGQGNSVQQVLTTIESVAGKQVPPRDAPRRPGDPAELVADPTRARQILGWKPVRSLREIVETAWRWANRQSRAPDLDRGPLPRWPKS
jgi:UDP-glucose-4-epimerase GalE